MIFKRKIYQKLLDWKNTSNGSRALLIEGARRIGTNYIIHPRNLSVDGNTIRIPAYMTICL